MRNIILSSIIYFIGLIYPIRSLADGEVPVEFTGPTWYDYRDTSFSIEGKGTLDNPIVINTAEELAQFAYYVNTCEVRTYVDSLGNKIVVLGNDIDLSKTVEGKRVQWIPIGYTSRGMRPANFVFLGVNVKEMDINNLTSAKPHTISGLYINIDKTAASNISKTSPSSLCYGLFASNSAMVGYLNIKDADISIDASATSENINIFAGLLNGQQSSTKRNITESDSQSDKITVANAIDGISAEGNITVTGKGAIEYVGGITGINSQSVGITHSCFKGNINTTNCKKVGGIAGSLEGVSITDCATDAKIRSNSTIENFNPCVGGIVGYQSDNSNLHTIESCVSMGSIKCSGTSTHIVGGICGFLGSNTSMYGCSSTMLIKSLGYVGGFAGQMSNSAGDGEYSRIEYCSFAGHVDGTPTDTDDLERVTYRHTSQPFDSYIGGFCGNMQWNDSYEHIRYCLFLGSMMNETYIYNYHNSVTVGTVGEGGNIASNVTNCYYDSRMYSGKVIPGIDFEERNTVIRPLPTEDLISGNSDKLSVIPIDNSAAYGFTFEKDKYPVAYSNNVLYAYKNLQTENDNSGFGALAKRLFNWDDMNKANTVYLAGANLCATPIRFVKGDCADDFVATLSAPNTSKSWKENESGRNIVFKSECLFPEVTNITVKDKTATAYDAGHCALTLKGSVNTRTTVFDRPVPLGGFKIIGLNITLNEDWYGSDYEAQGYAAGTGSAADPYLIKNVGQLLHAIRTNQEGEFYKQLCDLTICKGRDDNDDHLITMGLLQSITKPATRYEPSAVWYGYQNEWKANYNGDGHYVRGLYLQDVELPSGSEVRHYSLFGNVAENGSINNLGVVDTWIETEHTPSANTNYGIIAGEVYGSITNCIAQGFNASGKPCGGICSYVKQNGVIEDCISAVFPYSTTFDLFTPFVAYDNTLNKGTVRNCLSITPTMFSSADKKISDVSSIQDCYWLKGYEPANTGYTLEEIGTELSKRNRWTWTRNYLPMLKSFAHTDMGKLMMVPVRTDKNYNFDTAANTANNYLLGFTKMLEFEPGSATWSNALGTEYIESDSDLGAVTPIKTMVANPYVEIITPMEFLGASLGKAFYFIPLRTTADESTIQPGITFVDPHAEAACVAAFDGNDGSTKDGRLSLKELGSVTNEQTLNAFHGSNEGLQIVNFPEFRFFKGITTLTTQLSGLSELEEVRLPYNLQTIGGDNNFTGMGSLPFGMTKIKTITLPGKLTTVEPGAFDGSSIENIDVDPFNATLVSRDGILFDKYNSLVAFPNGRAGEEIVIPGVIEEIKPGAVYNITGLEKVYFDTDDYTTVADLNENGIYTLNGSLVDVFISDATYGSLLYNEYIDDESWEEYADQDKLHYYYPLKISSAKAGTMYIGFDTELPETLEPYIVTLTSKDDKLAYLKQTEREIPNRSPIVVFASEEGTYRLYPLDRDLEPWKMYNNLLNGVGKDGLAVTQGDSDRGSILTLGRNRKGELGFFYYRSDDKIPPYRAYLTYEWVTNSNPYLMFAYEEDIETDISHTLSSMIYDGNEAVYDLQGRKVADGSPYSPAQRLKKGIYIYNGKKIIIK
ncbi:MAG: leucine-rich repeat protein [Prevotella sp.]|nr:leucine-rich repeat protein [Prevotella sp.]